MESPLLSDAIFDPTDADHSFSAKVMLMAMPPPDALIEKTCQLAESSKLIFGIYKYTGYNFIFFQLLNDLVEGNRLDFR